MATYTIEAMLKATGSAEFARAMGDASDSVDSVSKNTNKASGGLKSFMGGVGKIAGAIGLTQLVASGFNAITSSVGAAVDRVDTLNRFPQMMESMGFSATESDAAISKLSDGIQGLPTTLDAVAATAQQLAIMTGDLDGATETTLALNNAFLASGSSSADAERGLQQYTQMLGKGEVDMQSWRTLQETMGVALNDTAEAFGFTGASAQNDLYSALQDGTITFDQFNSKIVELDQGVGGFSERALIASKGIKTSMGNIKTAITTGIANAIQTVDEAMQAGGFGSIADNLDLVKEKVKNAFTAINEGLASFVAFVSANLPTIQLLATFIGLLAAGFFIYNGILAITALVTAVAAGEITILTGVIALLTSPITWIIVAIAAFVAVLIYLYQTNETVRNVINTVWGFIKEFVMSIVGVVVGFVKTIWGSLVSFWTQNNELIMNTVKIAFNLIKTIITTVMNAILPFVIGTWETIKSVTSVVWNLITGLIRTALNIALGIIKAVMQAINGDWSGAWETVKATASTAWNNIKSIISDGIRGAYDVVVGFGKKFYDAGANIVGMIADGISSAIHKATDAIGNVVSKVRDFLPFSPAKTGPLQDLNKLNFGGTISDSIYGGQRQINRAMGSVLAVPEFDIGGSIARSNAQVNSAVSHEIKNTGNGRLENAISKLANMGVYLDGDSLVGGTYDRYNQTGGNKTQLDGRWVR